MIDINTNEDIKINITIECSSVSATYASIVDEVYDELMWSYHHGGEYNNDLENSLLQLLVDDELIQTVNSWAPMMKMMGGDETDKLIEVLTSDLQKALSTKSSFAIGRLHQSLMQFIENDDTGDGFGMSIIHLNPSTKEAIKTYIVSKLNASPLKRIIPLIIKLMNAMKRYLDNLTINNINENERTRLTQIISTFEDLNEDNIDKLNEHQVMTIHNIKPKAMEILFNNNSNTSNEAVQYLPTIPLESFQDMCILDTYATKFSELLLLDVVNIGSILGVRISKYDAVSGAVLISQLIDSGFGYVISSSKLMALLRYY